MHPVLVQVGLKTCVGIVLKFRHVPAQTLHATTALPNRLTERCDFFQHPVRDIRRPIVAVDAVLDVLDLPFRPDLGRPERDNAVDGYINQNEEDVTADGIWQRYFTRQPEPFTKAEQRAYLDTVRNVALGSDAFFPFSDNIERAFRSGFKYVAEPGGSIRDDHVIMTCNQYGIAMAFTGQRLFHH